MSQRLNPREKVMVAIVGGAALLIVNFFLISYFLSTLNKLQRDTVQRQADLSKLKAQVAETPLWTERDGFVGENQPHLENESRAQADLLEQVRVLGKEKEVLIVEPNIPGTEHPPQFTGIRSNFKTKSTWKALVSFLHGLQTPEKFISVSRMTLAVDTADPTQMRGDFELMKLYAPK